MSPRAELARCPACERELVEIRFDDEPAPDEGLIGSHAFVGGWHVACARSVLNLALHSRIAAAPAILDALGVALDELKERGLWSPPAAADWRAPARLGHLMPLDPVAAFGRGSQQIADLERLARMGAFAPARHTIPIADVGGEPEREMCPGEGEPALLGGMCAACGRRFEMPGAITNGRPPPHWREEPGR